MYEEQELRRRQARRREQLRRQKLRRKVLEGIEDFSIEGQEPVVMKWVEDKGYKLGDVMNAFRIVLLTETDSSLRLVFLNCNQLS